MKKTTTLTSFLPVTLLLHFRKSFCTHISLITEFLQDFSYNSCDIVLWIAVRIDTFNNFYTGIDKIVAKICTRINAEYTNVRIPIILHTRESGQLVERSNYLHYFYLYINVRSFKKNCLNFICHYRIYFETFDYKK